MHVRRQRSRLPAAPRTRRWEGGQRLGLLKQLTCVPGTLNRFEADGRGGRSQQRQRRRRQAEVGAQGGLPASQAAIGMPQVTKNLVNGRWRTTLSGHGLQGRRFANVPPRLPTATCQERPWPFIQQACMCSMFTVTLWKRHHSNGDINQLLFKTRQFMRRHPA